MLSIYIDPAVFQSDAAFAEEIRRFVDWVKSSEKASPNGEITEAVYAADTEARLRHETRLVEVSRAPIFVWDLDGGIEAGRFKVDDPAVALIAAGGALLAIVRAVLQGRAKQTDIDQHAAYVLRMFGLSPDDAAEVASRPLPTGEWIHPKNVSADG